MADYKIGLGVSLDTSDIVSQINEAQKKVKPIEIKVDAETKELTNTIKDALKSLSSGTKNVLTLDTTKVETSLNDVASTIKEIKTAMGTLDSGAGMKTLLSSINQISTALDKAAAQFESLNANLNALSGKDLSLNFGINLGGSNSVARQGVYGSKVRNETLPQLKQQVNDLVEYYNSTYKESLNELEALQKLVSGTKLSNGDFFEGFLYGKDSVASRMGNGSLSSQMQAYKAYIDMFKQAASLKGIDLSSVTSSFSKSADQLIQDAQDVQTGAKEMEDGFEKLKQIFSGGNNINIDGISAQLDSIVADLGEIKTALQGLSSGVSLEGLTQSFDKLSETLEKLVSNATLVKNALGDGLDTTTSNDGVEKGVQDQKEFAQASTQSANVVVQSEEKKQQTYKETAGVIENLKTTLETMKLDRSSIDTITKDVEELGFAVTDASVKMKNGDFDITVKGIDSMGRVITEIRHLDSATDEISGMGRTISQTFKESDTFIKQQKKSVSDLTNQINQLNRAANDQNASRAIKDSSHLDTLANKYDEITVAIQRMEAASSDTFLDEQNNVKKLISEYKSLVTEFKNAENVSSKMKGTDFASGLDIAKNDLAKFKAEAKDFPQITKTIEELDNAIENVGDSASLNKFTDQLKVARSELAKIKSETSAANRSEKVGINVSGLESKIKDIQRISPEIDKFEAEIDGAKVSVQSLLNDLKQVNTQGDFSVVNARFRAFAESAKAAGIAISETVSKVKSISDIKNKLKDTGFNGFTQEVQRAKTAVESLDGSYDDLNASLKQLDVAMEAVNSADQANDTKKLVAANEEYENSLKRVISLLKMYQDAESLDTGKEKALLRLESLYKEGSEAAQKYGAEVDELKRKIESCGNVKGLTSLNKQIDVLGQKIKNANVQTQTFGQQLKAQFSKYSAYFGVAEVFMYTEQALRSMFEQVKLIDSAMTELKKVTDETDASYNQFLTNAASRAKALGTTIDGLVASTADFARLGYGFEEAQGLAEVANIYAVVGDDINNVEEATQSLISTLTAFKNEANGLSDSDFAMSIVDKMNEVSNNFAISSGGIGEALQRSASSMMAANNSLDETIALITAANTVVQDPESVGRLMPTLKVAISVKLQRWTRPSKDFI